jgi:hypothetical protein
MTRILLLIAAFILAIILAFLAAVLPWIPEWSTFQTVAAILGIVCAAAATVFLLRTIFLRTKDRLQGGMHVVLTVITGIVMGFLLFAASFILVFFLTGNIFAPTYKQKFAFPEYSTTIYVYDASFLDPEAQFRIRRGFWPFATSAGTFFGYDAEHLHIDQVGEWAIYEDFKVHLPTGEVETHNTDALEDLFD